MSASSSPTRHWPWLLLALLVIASAAAATQAARATEPGAPQAATSIFLPAITGFAPVQLELVPFAFGFENKTITAIRHAGDERLFVAGREGKVWIVNPDGSINPDLFLDISDRTSYSLHIEQGLLGLAFHPQYPTVPYFYVAYTTANSIRIARGTVSATNPNVADRDSLRPFLSIAKPPATDGPSHVHNAGDIAFGPDGYLYIPLGDGGPDPNDPLGVPGDPFNHSQRRDVMLGSILRIDPDPARGLPPDCGMDDIYSIPPDNPFLGDGGCDEIWAKGLRNPWRIAFDSLNGDLYIADVGEWRSEEVNYYPANTPGGANFGWHCWEGTTDYTTVHPEIAGTCQPGTPYVFPVFEYGHQDGRCSITGGKVYRGSKYPVLTGRYIFGDWCTGDMWTLVRDKDQWRADTAGNFPINFSTFGEDVHGELYAGGYANGMLYKVRPATN